MKDLNGYYIEASIKVFDILVKSGYVPQSTTTWLPDRFKYFIISNGIICGTKDEVFENPEYNEIQAYLHNGEIVTKKPKDKIIIEGTTIDCNNLPIDEVVEQLQAMCKPKESEIPEPSDFVDYGYGKEPETISITDSEGKEYLFLKPEFEIGLEFILGEWIYGWIDDDALNFNHRFLCAWNVDCGTAICVDGSHSGYSIYNITRYFPQLPWYEDESNFPALVTAEEDSEALFQIIDRLDAVSFLKQGWRLAKKEEVESLYYEGKQNDLH